MTVNDFTLKLEDMSLVSNPQNYETIFSLSNGYLGTRGSKEEDFLRSSDADQGTFLNGFYESEPIIYGEQAYGYAQNSQTIVRVPNAKQFAFSFNGTCFSEGDISNESHYLDMEKGILHRTFTWTSKNKEMVEVKTERFVSMTNKNYLFMTYEVKPITDSGRFCFEGQFSDQDRTNDNRNDPRKAKSLAHYVSTELKYDQNDNAYLITKTTNSKLSMISSLILSNDNERIRPEIDKLSDGYHYTFEKTVFQNNVFTVTLQVFYSDFYQNEELVTYTKDDFLSYEEEKNKHENYWKYFWQVADIKIKGDEQLQKGIRHNLFHLNQAAGRDGKTNISAKGITSDGYEGHYFWDTEMYMLPFFIYTQPDVAKKLLMNRYNILENAKNRAKELGIESGALFPWRTINGEECSAYYPAGTAQVHINGDIAYAIQTYVDVTGDTDFMLHYGAEVLIEVARFWISFGCFKKDQFLINGVTGPDEYTALVNNNFYTNKLAQYNLQSALQIVKSSEVRTRFNVSNDEIFCWKQAAKKMRLPYDEETQITLQDDGMNARKIWPFETTTSDKYPLLLHFHPMMIYKHQVNKQADTVLSQYLFENDFEKEQLARDYAYYESVTTHDSSLSRSIFGVMATRIDEVEKGYTYFMDTVAMDLQDIQGNTIDGIHAANLGGMWLGLIKGFGGISLLEGELSINPHLPKKWQELSFHLKYQRRLLEITIIKDKLRIILESGEKIRLAIHGQSYILENELLILL